MTARASKSRSPGGGAIAPDRPSATELILDILSLLDKARLTAAQLRLAGEAYGFSAVTMRAAASRLCDRGRLIAVERGAYALPANISAARRFIRSWPSVVDEMTDWNREWWLAIAPRPSDAPRSAIRGVEKLLLRYGFRRWRASFYVRPANLAGGIERLRALIASWPHGDEVSLATLADVGEERADGFFDEWRDFQPDYRRLAARLKASRASLSKRALADAAAEALGLGRRGVKTILADPRLPEPHGDLKGLAALLDEMRAYERAGQTVWIDYLDIGDY